MEEVEIPTVSGVEITDKKTLTGKGGSNFLSMLIVVLGFNHM